MSKTKFGGFGGKFGGPFTEEEVEDVKTFLRPEQRGQIQAIAEEHYERYMNQEEEYMREQQYSVTMDSDVELSGNEW